MFKASLAYGVNSMAARSTQRNSVSKNKTPKKKKKTKNKTTIKEKERKKRYSFTTKRAMFFSFCAMNTTD